jgi:hypothetical protein
VARSVRSVRSRESPGVRLLEALESGYGGTPGTIVGPSANFNFIQDEKGSIL